jgi:hypothetical protein
MIVAASGFGTGWRGPPAAPGRMGRVPQRAERCDNPPMSESPYKTGTTHFGFRDVAAKDKQKLVGEVFTSVARS